MRSILSAALVLALLPLAACSQDVGAPVPDDEPKLPPISGPDAAGPPEEQPDAALPVEDAMPPLPDAGLGGLFPPGTLACDTTEIIGALLCTEVVCTGVNFTSACLLPCAAVAQLSPGCVDCITLIILGDINGALGACLTPKP